MGVTQVLFFTETPILQTGEVILYLAITSIVYVSLSLMQTDRTEPPCLIPRLRKSLDTTNRDRIDDADRTLLGIRLCLYPSTASHFIRWQNIPGLSLTRSQLGRWYFIAIMEIDIWLNTGTIRSMVRGQTPIQVSEVNGY